MGLLDPEARFHIGVVVEDIAAAMDEMTALVGHGWRPRIRGESVMRAGGVERVIPVDAVYSIDGPPYVELIARLPGSIWDRTGLHHFGFWADDVPARAAELQAGGIPIVCELTRDGRSLATYHRTQSGVYVELIAESSRRRLFQDE